MNHIPFFSGLSQLTILVIFIVVLATGCKDIESDTGSMTDALALGIVTENFQDNPSTENSIRNFVKEYYKNEVDHLSPDDKKLTYYDVDLNNDGLQEFILYMDNNHFCGSGGCSLLILSSDLKLINAYDIVEPPLYVESSEGNKWSDIVMTGYEEDGNTSYIRLSYDDLQASYPINLSTVETISYTPLTSAVTLWGTSTKQALILSF